MPGTDWRPSVGRRASGNVATGFWAGQAAAAGGPVAAWNRLAHCCWQYQPSGRLIAVLAGLAIALLAFNRPYKLERGSGTRARGARPTRRDSRATSHRAAPETGARRRLRAAIQDQERSRLSPKGQERGPNAYNDRSWASVEMSSHCSGGSAGAPLRTELRKVPIKGENQVVTVQHAEEAGPGN